MPKFQYKTNQGTFVIDSNRKLNPHELEQAIIDQPQQQRNFLSQGQQTLSRAQNIGQRPPLAERIVSKGVAALPPIGQFVGGMVGTIEGARRGTPGRGGIVGGTLGRSLARLGQLSINQFRENPVKFVKEALNPLSGGVVGGLIRNTTPEQKKFMINEFLTTLGSETLFTGLGKFAQGALKGATGELIGKRASERGFEVGFKELTDPKFRQGRVPKAIAERMGRFFPRLRNVSGKSVGEAINRTGVGDSTTTLVNNQPVKLNKLVSEGLKDIEKRLGGIEELGELTSPAQKRLIRQEIEFLKTLANQKRLNIRNLWEGRRKFDKIAFGKKFSEEATEYLENVRRLINNPIKSSSEEVAQKFGTYRAVVKLEKQIGKKFQTDLIEGDIFAVDAEPFSAGLVNTKKDEAVRRLRALDGLLQANDQVIEDLLNMAGAEQLATNINAVTLIGKTSSGGFQGRLGLARALQFAQQPFGIPRGITKGTVAGVGRLFPVAGAYQAPLA